MGQDEEEKDAKNRNSRNSASEITNPLEMVKKHFSLLNRSILKSELGVRPKLRFWAKISRKQTQKKQSSRNSASELTNALEMVKKTCQSLESLNSNVRARSQAQIMILGQDSEAIDAKNRTKTNSASEVMNPLEMVKKHFRLLNRSILMSEQGVRPKFRFWAKMRRKKTRKIGRQKFSF